VDNGFRRQAGSSRVPESRRLRALVWTDRRETARRAHDDCRLAPHLHRSRIVDFAAKYRLPSMFPTREFVLSRGLMFYGGSIPEMFQQAAAYVDKIVKGAKPADLPVEQPTKFQFVINIKTGESPRAHGPAVPGAASGSGHRMRNVSESSRRTLAPRRLRGNARAADRGSRAKCWRQQSCRRAGSPGGCVAMRLGDSSPAGLDGVERSADKT
jgi:ABC transporter substrate binding protein